MKLRTILITLTVSILVVSCSGGDKEQKSSSSSTKTVAEKSTEKVVQSDCLTLINSRCTKCHYIKRICEKLGKKSKGRWKSTVKRMVDRGAELSTSEKTTILECLVQPTEEFSAACNN